MWVSVEQAKELGKKRARQLYEEGRTRNECRPNPFGSGFTFLLVIDWLWLLTETDNNTRSDIRPDALEAYENTLAGNLGQLYAGVHLHPWYDGKSL